MATRSLPALIGDITIWWPPDCYQRNSTGCNYLVVTRLILIKFFKEMTIRWPLDRYQHHTSRKWRASGQQIITNNILWKHDDLLTTISLPTSFHKAMTIWWPLDHYKIVNPRCNYLVTARSCLTSLLDEVMIY